MQDETWLITRERLRHKGWRGAQAGILLLTASGILRSPLLFVLGVVVFLLAILYVRAVNKVAERFRKEWIDELTGRDTE